MEYFLLLLNKQHLFSDCNFSPSESGCFRVSQLISVRHFMVFDLIFYFSLKTKRCLQIEMCHISSNKQNLRTEVT